MKLRRKAAILVAIMVPPVAGAAYALFLFGPGGDGVVARLQRPDGVEYRVTQKYDGEPYSISFYRRGSDDRWGWCYIDHEVTRWHSTTLSYDANTQRVRLFEADRLYAEYSEASATVSHFDSDGHVTWTADAPQEWRDPEF